MAEGFEDLFARQLGVALADPLEGLELRERGEELFAGRTLQGGVSDSP